MSYYARTVYERRMDRYYEDLDDQIECVECGNATGERYSDYDRHDPPPVDPLCKRCEEEQAMADDPL